MLKNKFNKKVSVILTAVYIMCLNLSVGFAETNGYSDTENHWAGEAIEFVTEKGIMNGIGDGKFEPERKMTRGEFLAVAARTFRQTSGNTDDSNNLYADISKTQWNAPYIAALKANGTSEIGDMHHIERGYEKITERLSSLGADISYTR